MPSVPRMLHQGLAADKPTADASVNQGWLYYETDTDELKQSWNGAWTMINAGGGVTSTVKLAEIVIGVGGAASIDFTGIDGTYRELRISGVLRGDHVDYTVDARMTINGDTGAHYDYCLAFFFDGAVGAFGVLGDPSYRIGDCCAANAPADDFGAIDVQLPGYHETFRNKNIRASVAAQGQYTNAHIGDERTIGYWNSTAAVTEITVAPASGLWVENSRLSLYGIH